MTDSNYNTPAIPDVIPDLGALAECVQAIKECVEAREGRIGPYPSLDRFVKASELNPQTINNVSYISAAVHASSHSSGGSDEVSHNNLANKQGGTTDEYYHLTESDHTNRVTFQQAAALGTL